MKIPAQPARIEERQNTQNTFLGSKNHHLIILFLTYKNDKNLSQQHHFTDSTKKKSNTEKGEKFNNSFTKKCTILLSMNIVFG